MNISDKIIALRKKEGWSQETLAYNLDVSRQAVSKWESGMAVPEIDKIVKMSQLFGVSTDSLLKDDDAEGTHIQYEDVPKARNVSTDDADNYLAEVKKRSPFIALGAFLCIISPILLLLLPFVSVIGTLSESVAISIGIIVLIVLVAIAVALFIINGTSLEKYRYLSREKIIISNTTKEKIVSMKSNSEKSFITAITIGVTLCILSVLPLILAPAFNASGVTYIICTCALLFIVAVSVFIFILFNMKRGALKRLLEEDEFAPEYKKENPVLEIFSGTFWMVAVVTYLLWSFLSKSWSVTWIVWPVAGVVYGMTCTIISTVLKNKQK